MYGHVSILLMSRRRDLELVAVLYTYKNIDPAVDYILCKIYILTGQQGLVQADLTNTKTMVKNTGLDLMISPNNS